METVTRREIDTLKDWWYTHRDELSEEESNKMENEIIEKVNLYKVLYPNHTKTIQRWRNWYRIVRSNMDKHFCPKEHLDKLLYIFDTFRVDGEEKGMTQLNNWYNTVKAGGYCLKEETIERINNVIGDYGYTLK